MAVVIKIISTEEVVHYKYSAKVFNISSKSPRPTDRKDHI